MAAKTPKTPVEIPSNGINCVRDLFLWCMSAIYLFAFGSLYYQVPGLYGDNGILPAKLFLKPVGRTFEQNFAFKPTLVWMAPMIGLDVQLTVELIALAGVIVAFVALLSRKLRNVLTFALLWVLYLSLYQVGQTFTWFQWDILLLEAGFLTVLVSPLHLLQFNASGQSYHGKIVFWLVRWLLFRLMFASGVVKLTSLCPTWWNLSALSYHFESQCIPTPLSWYAHQLPTWILKLGVIGTYVIEIAVPFLFFAPIRSLRLFSFYAQVLLQVAILLTGNYNFFNLLTMVLCISLLDDEHFAHSAPVVKKQADKKKSQSSTLAFVGRLLSRLLEFATYSALVYWTVALFSLRVTPERTLESKIAFTKEEFHRALELVLQVSIYVGAVSLATVVLTALYRTARYTQGCFGKPLNLLYCLFCASVALWIFAISMVPHTVVDKQANSQVWPVVRKWHDSVDQLQLVSPYGLFRRMTGVGGRPEVVIEGSNSLTTGWKEYHFMYKIGNVSALPPIAAPHQPRLDWQMWFAALGTYQQNPWFLSLVHRLLIGQKEVLDLLDKSRNPFPSQPPKFIRAISYSYQYTAWNSRKPAQDWWTRKNVGEYLPAISKDHPSLKEYLHNNNLIEVERKRNPVKNATLKEVLTVCRRWICQMSAPVFLAALFATAFILKVLPTGGKGSSR